MKIAMDHQISPVPISQDSISTKRPARLVNGSFQPQANMTVEPPPYDTIAETDANSEGCYGSIINGLGAIIATMGALPCCFCCPNPFQNVQQGNIGLITKFGRFHKTVEPGLVNVNPLSEQLMQIDVKLPILDVPGQACMTMDGVGLQLSSAISYRVVSPHMAAIGVANVRQALVENIQVTLRNVVRARVLQDIIERREEVAESASETIEVVANGLGVRVESILINDIILSQEIQTSQPMPAPSKRGEESNIIAARAEAESSKLKS